MESTENQIRDIIAQVLGISFKKVTPDSVLHNLGADYIDIAEIIMELELSYHIAIPSHIEFNAVQDYITYIKGRRVKN